ncbi:ubiquinol-cytochrome c reductase iron-sulfur subunit [Candidatus Poriferisodalis sp.]|uniref:ubiquinol-cytochrome c reductase iron-sulfur subunit n=1 Tax=Candidatus Poriferisodalis sp. TaxID=3101277 RepID=UPI003B52D5B4
MSTGTILAIAIPVIVVLGAVVAFVSLRRRDATGLGHMSRETRRRDELAAGAAGDDAAAEDEAGAFGISSQARELERSVALERRPSTVAVAEPELPQDWAPPPAEEVGVTRRQFLNRSSVLLMATGLGTFNAAMIAFLWPRPTGGFGSKIKIGSVASVDEAITSSTPAENFSYFSEAQSYIQPYPTDSATLANAETVYGGSVLDAMRQGYVALWQVCPHLGCKVPVCGSSQWFECPCHGSKYNRVGEKKSGPAPRGMDRFPVTIEGGNVFVDTGKVSQGPAIGTDTTGQGLEGPHCA